MESNDDLTMNASVSFGDDDRNALWDASHSAASYIGHILMIVGGSVILLTVIVLLVTLVIHCTGFAMVRFQTPLSRVRKRAMVQPTTGRRERVYVAPDE